MGPVMYKSHRTKEADMQGPANDNDDPDVILAKKIGRAIGAVATVALAVYLIVTYVLPR